jgi:hypothetical protein
MTVLDNIDSESALLLAAYTHKWRALALSTQPINLEQAKTAVENVYANIGKGKPSVLFCPSPFSALSVLIDLQLSGQFGQLLNILNDLYFEPYFQEMFKVHHYMKDQERIFSKYAWWESIRQKLNQIYRHQFLRKISTQFQVDQTILKQQLRLSRQELFPLNCYGNYCSGKIELWSGAVDFCIKVLGCGNFRQWQLIESLIQACGWIFPLDGLALVCARPTRLSVDVDDRLHTESGPALQYSDGYSFYSFHGQIVKPKQLTYLINAEKNGKLQQAAWELSLSSRNRRKLKNLSISYFPL